VRLSFKDTGHRHLPRKNHGSYSSRSARRSDTTRRYGGTGLGLGDLPATRDLMGGSIEMVERTRQGEILIALLTKLLRICRNRQGSTIPRG